MFLRKWIELSMPHDSPAHRRKPPVVPEPVVPPVLPVLPAFEDLPPLELQDEFRRRMAEAHEERMLLYDLIDDNDFKDATIQEMIDATHPENAKPPWEDEDDE